MTEAEKSDAVEASRSPTCSAPSIEAAYAIGAKGGPVVEEERLAFEAWMRGHCWAVDAEWDGEGYRGAGENKHYVCPKAMRIRQLWAAWRDRAALTPHACLTGPAVAELPEGDENANYREP